MSDPATPLNPSVPLATVELLTYIGDLTQVISNPSEMIPHSFLKVTDVQGKDTYVGLAPQQQGQLVGTGAIFDNKTHPEFNSSGPITLSSDQATRLVTYVNDSIAKPPYYNLPEGSQCAVWALNGVFKAVTGTDIDLTVAATPENPLGNVDPYVKTILN
jgi:hypothetical protein